MPVSNDNGRVLEYMIVNQIENTIKNRCKLTKNAINQNTRDVEKLPLISKELLNHYEKNVPKISDWIIKNFNDELIEIDRLSDSFGMKGDVTDIRIKSGTKTLNISCKNNNTSVKHQRPGTTPEHFGLQNNDNLSKIFKVRYSEINSNFYLESKSKNLNLKYYNEIEEKKKTKYLYNPICNLVSEFINSNSSKGDIYQKFLLGHTDYTQIILNKKNIEIKEFSNLPKSNLVSSFINNNGHIIVDFHNSIILSMRLHNASSKITETGSLKFDTKIEKMNIPITFYDCV